MAFEDFLRIAHIGLIGLYLFTIGYYIRSRYFKDKETWETIYDANLDPHDNPENANNAGNLATLTLGHAIIWGFSQQVFPIVLIVLILGFVFCVKRLADVEPVFKRIEHKKRLERRYGSKTNNGGFQEPPSGDDDYFSYKSSSGGSNKQRRASSASPEMPYGVDKRHPDDAKFWAVVDDPNASDGERQNAFSAILKKQAKRKGRSGNDITST
ncbi:hypothetical protein [uncultured Shimia sp.]|uniref:hypothetical protein n=1 Tax=uncultured Shimia sp. TaxID=573152 RepID=UPI00262A24D8|nr:hypothetical protein [uncultured Shimia sp.]